MPFIKQITTAAFIQNRISNRNEQMSFNAHHCKTHAVIQYIST